MLIESYDGSLRSACPETAGLLEYSRIHVHPAVTRIILEGSRGPGGGFRSDSDIDLGLVVDTAETIKMTDPGPLLREVLEATLKESYCPVELDIAAIHDPRNCGLICLDASGYDTLSCSRETTGCMSVYKIQKGFDGFVPPIIEINKIFPFITIWRR